MTYLITFLLFFSTQVVAEVKTKIEPTLSVSEKLLHDEFSKDKNEIKVFDGILNTHAQIDIGEKREISLNWNVRYINTTNDDKNPIRFKSTNYPVNSISRNLFRLRKKDKGKYSYTESTLNEFYYRWKDEESTVTLGRMFVKFGDGMTFNPVNPFSLPQNLTTTQTVDQGNDGISFRIKKSEMTTLNLYLFGNQDLEDSNEDLTRTIFLNAEVHYNLKNDVYYILGEDQKRNLFGFQYKYSFADGLIFLQAVHKTKRADEKKDSESIDHFLLGIEKDITSYYTARIEGGKHGYDKKSLYTIPEISRHPLNSFIALINDLKLSDYTLLRLNYYRDTKTNFDRSEASLFYEFSKYFSGSLFYAKTLHLDTEHKYAGPQKEIPREAGLSLVLKI